MLISEIPEVLTVYNFVYSGCPFGCSNHPHLLEKDGERGRNRTYNLLIKSQLLCQLSYAPTVSGKAGTNFDYSIRLTLPSARSALYSSTLLQLSSPAWVTVSYQERSHAMEAVRLA